jgi:hypothetical protein
VFENYTKANSFIVNLPKTMKINRGWTPSEVLNKNGKLEIAKKEKSIQSKADEPTAVKHINHYEKDIQPNDKEYLEFIQSLESYFNKLNERLLDLNYKLDILSKEQVDFEHYIEFNKLSASEGYQAYKMFHDSRIQRRLVKDEISKINLIISTFKEGVNFQDIKHQLNKIDVQTYSPRVKFELFEKRV